MPIRDHKFDPFKLQQAASMLGVDRETIKHIGGFENIVYGYTKEERDLILRVGHSSHRTPALVASEMDFIDYLARHGVRIAKPVAFSSGELIQIIGAEKGEFILTVFEKAPGTHIQVGHKSWRPQLFEQWGEITAQMHALAMDYKLPEGMTERPHQDNLEFDAMQFNAEEHMLYEKFLEVDAKINALPREAGAYGLCHRDLHQGNFFVHDGNIVAFDFDDCGQDYVVQDIAMAVYYGSIFGDWSKPEYEQERTSKLGNELLKYFMTGYKRYYQLDTPWLEQLPLFIEKRRLELCLLLYKPYSENVSDVKQAWLRRNLQDVEQGRACMELQLNRAR